MNRFPWLLALFFTLTVSAQEKLIIRGTPLDMYVMYASNGTESLQNISNVFGLSVSKLSAYNNTNINPNAVLAKGTEVKIPFTKDNLLQNPSENSGTVVHVIKKGENLYRLSQLYNKVPIASLRQWNGMKNDIVKEGQQIIVGYMVNAKPMPASDRKAIAKKITDTVRKEPALETRALVDDNKKIPDVTKTVVKDLSIVAEPAPGLKSGKATEEKNSIPGPQKSEEASGQYVPKEGDEGFFATIYPDHSKEQAQQFHTGDAAIFKTISGWTDRKYYVLMNDIAPKTVIRITGPTHKSICAMVLGPLQETKGAAGLLLRLSNSAAFALGVSDPKFTVTVTYFE
jgi:LysM repeat protein